MKAKQEQSIRGTARLLRMKEATLRYWIKTEFVRKPPIEWGPLGWKWWAAHVATQREGKRLGITSPKKRREAKKWTKRALEDMRGRVPSLLADLANSKPLSGADLLSNLLRKRLAPNKEAKDDEQRGIPELPSIH